MKKKLWFMLLLSLIVFTVTVAGCEKNSNDPPFDGSTDADTETDTENGTESGAPNENEGKNDGSGDGETDSDNGSEDVIPPETDTAYPPSDPSDPYENDKHWELP